MMNKMAFGLFNSIIIILIGMSVTFAQEPTLLLKEKKITLELEKKSLEEVFYHLLVKYDIPIGFEGSTLDNDHTDYLFKTNIPENRPDKRIIDGSYRIKKHWITVKVNDASLKDVLDIIVGQMENYKWEINDEVVNIIPIIGRDPRYEKLLGVNISNFTFEKNSAVGLLRNKINDLPEIKKFLEESKIITTNSRAFTENLFRKIPNEMNFSNLTFRELLNKITKVKRGGWILRKNYLYRSKEKEFIEIDI